MKALEVCGFCGRGAYWEGFIVWHHWFDKKGKVCFARVCKNCNCLLTESLMERIFGGFPEELVQKAFAISSRRSRSTKEDKFQVFFVEELNRLGYWTFLSFGKSTYRKKGKGIGFVLGWVGNQVNLWWLKGEVSWRYLRGWKIERYRSIGRFLKRNGGKW